MTHKTLIVSIFDDELAADSAAAQLKETGLTYGDAMGILALDAAGKLKVDKVGARSTGKGAGVGALLFLLGPGAVGVGVIGGAAAGALHHKGLDLDESDRERITKELNSGRAAVGVLAGASEAEAVSNELIRLGGVSESHDVTEDGLEAVAAGDTAS